MANFEEVAREASLRSESQARPTRIKRLVDLALYVGVKTNEIGVPPRSSPPSLILKRNQGRHRRLPHKISRYFASSPPPRGLR